MSNDIGSHDPQNAGRPNPPWARRDEADYECNYCGASTSHDDTLGRSRGRACPYCGEGVIQEVER